MEKSQILSADILDILFDGRNKMYGAYALRKTYQQRMLFALSAMLLLCLLVVAGSLLANGKKNRAPAELVTVVELENFKPEEPKPIPKQEPLKVEMAKVTPPRIVADDQVKAEDEVKEIDQLENTRIGTINQEGPKDEGVVAPPVEKTTGVVENFRETDEMDKVFASVQIEAQFLGGIAAWRKYLERNLNQDIAAQNGAPPADYSVLVSFIVDREGNISDVRAENDPGYGTRAEAIRVIQKSPRWTPAVQNGRHVIYRQKQKITFRVEEQ
ncbi:MAG: energy transducer TonB [Bacteroidetes bacterium]|nr:energy transducer TonB [Bacteroidota bacterium]